MSRETMVFLILPWSEKAFRHPSRKEAKEHAEKLASAFAPRGEKTMSERKEWVPSFYDGYETRWSDEDQCYLARCAPEYGLLAFVTTHGDTREEAVQKLVEILPDVACMNHSTHDEWVQRARKAEAEVERLRSRPETPTHITRALALVDMALESREGLAAVGRQTGGNAPELVQGILDRIAQLWGKAPETPTGSETRYMAEKLRRAANGFVGYSATHHGAGETLIDAALAAAKLLDRAIAAGGSTTPEERPPDAMCHATHWWKHLHEWDGELTLRPYDAERVASNPDGPPWPVWIGAAPTQPQPKAPKRWKPTIPDELLEPEPEPEAPGETEDPEP